MSSSGPHADRVFILGVAYLVTPTPLHLLRDSTPYRVVRQQRERRERLVRRRTRPRFEEPLFDSYFFIRVPIRRDDGVSHHVHENRATHVVRHLAAAIHTQARDFRAVLRQLLFQNTLVRRNVVQDIFCVELLRLT